MTLLTLLKQAAFELGKGAVMGVAKGISELIAGKPSEPTARGLSHQDVERQQAQIRSATAHKVPRPGPFTPPRKD